MDNEEMIHYIMSVNFISGVMLGIELYDAEGANDPSLKWGLVVDLLILRFNLSVHHRNPV